MLARTADSRACSAAWLGRQLLQLAAAGVELVVGDVQLLDGGLGLLVQGLQLLVARLQLLVEGLDLLGGHLRRRRRQAQLLTLLAEPIDGVGQLPVGASSSCRLALAWRSTVLAQRRQLGLGTRRPSVPWPRAASTLGVTSMTRTSTVSTRPVSGHPIRVAADGQVLGLARGDFRGDDGGELPGRLARQNRVDARAQGGRGDPLGQVDQILAERQAVDAEQLPGRAVDDLDVVVPIDHDHPDRQPAHHFLGPPPRKRASEVASSACRSARSMTARLRGTARSPARASASDGVGRRAGGSAGRGPCRR